MLVPDVNGVLRGKRVRREEFKSIFGKGFNFPGGTVLLDTLGDCIPDMAWSSDDGDPDADARAVDGSLAPVPWAKRAAGQALFRLYFRDGKPFFADPRHVLENAMRPLQKKRAMP